MKKNNSSKFKTNSKSGFFKRKDKLTTRTGKQFNDMSWYLKNPAITKSFANIPFNYILGMKYKLHANPTSVVSFIPDWNVSYGPHGAFGSGRMTILDQVATIIYTTMRRSNAGATNDIEYVDPIMSNLLASIDIVCNAVNLRRTFKIANTFSWKNRTIPKEIFLHMGLDWEDFIANQAAYRGKLNSLVAMARTIKTLNNFPFLNAAMSEYENIFKDSDTDTGRESIIVPIKAFHHIYDPVGSTDNPGGMVRLMNLGDLGVNGNPTSAVVTYGDKTGSAKRKFSVDLAILEKQINALINDADFNLIQADIEKAFGEQSGYIVIDSIPDTPEPITPLYSGEFLTFFENGNFLPMPSLSKITSSGNAPYIGTQFLTTALSYQNLVCQRHDPETGEVCLGAMTYMIGNVSTNAMKNVVSCDVDSPSEEQVVAMTRYKCLSSSQTTQLPFPESTYCDASSGKVFFDVASNIICFGGMITNIHYDGDISYASDLRVVRTTWENWNSVRLTLSYRASETRVDLRGFENIYNWMWSVSHAPFRWFEFTDMRSENIVFNTMLGDINNVKELTKEELIGIQESCFLSLWDLPARSNI